ALSRRTPGSASVGRPAAGAGAMGVGTRRLEPPSAAAEDLPAGSGRLGRSGRRGPAPGSLHPLSDGSARQPPRPSDERAIDERPPARPELLADGEIVPPLGRSTVDADRARRLPPLAASSIEDHARALAR